ncbi:hypothetical protein BS78_08G079100 [Paspalum vaginatum]|nr:hypothetical protein BS78_08G079100 [Paspalum vaginatum]
MLRVSKRPRRAVVIAGTFTTKRAPVISGGGVHVVQEESEEGNWKDLFPDLVNKIADSLLSDDVTENWLLLAGEKLHDGKDTERLLNVRTGATLRIRLKDPNENTHHGNVQGLLVLYHALTDTISLVNPLTLTSMDDLSTLASLNSVGFSMGATTSFLPTNIKAAGIIVEPANQQQQQQAPPTVVLSLTKGRRTALFCAKPRDFIWTSIDISCTNNIEGSLPAIQGALSMPGGFYVPTRDGDVLALELRPYPRLTYVARQANNGNVGFNEISYLVPHVEEDGGMLLVRTSGPGNNLGRFFTVDLGNRRLARYRLSNTDTTVFLPSVTLRSSVFPSVKPNTVYNKNLKKLLRGGYI